MQKVAWSIMLVLLQTCHLHTTSISLGLPHPQLVRTSAMESLHTSIVIIVEQVVSMESNKSFHDLGALCATLNEAMPTASYA